MLEERVHKCGRRLASFAIGVERNKRESVSVCKMGSPLVFGIVCLVVADCLLKRMFVFPSFPFLPTSLQAVMVKEYRTLIIEPGNESTGRCPV